MTTGGRGSTCSRTAVTTASSWATRSAALPQGTPSRAASSAASGRPVPIPSSNRPSLSRCSADASRTTAAGLRIGDARTHVRNRIRGAATAAAASAGNGDTVHRVSGTSTAAYPRSSSIRTCSTHDAWVGPGVATTAKVTAISPR